MRRIFLPNLGFIAVTACMLISLSEPAASALLDHFKGRYGAIEVADAGKKLSFRVNPPELSQKRNFCQFDDLAIAIALVERGALVDFNAPIATLLPGLSERDQAKNSTLKQALRQGNREVFAALLAKLTPAQLQALRARNLLPSGSAHSAFELLEWFKALQGKRLGLKPTTLLALRQVLVQKSRGSGTADNRGQVARGVGSVSGGTQTFWSFSSRCAEPNDAAGRTMAVGATLGFIDRPGTTPIFFAATVDGKSRSDLFNVAVSIRDAALKELQYWPPVVNK